MRTFAVSFSLPLCIEKTLYRIALLEGGESRPVAGFYQLAHVSLGEVLVPLPNVLWSRNELDVNLMAKGIIIPEIPRSTKEAPAK